MDTEEYREVLRDIIQAEDPALRAARHLVLSFCVCNVGVQDCPVHLYHYLKTQEEKIQFRKDWDARVA